ncbi:hypothetical protein DL96DRAFT_351962 [Flagelloscypha sp. PMI_526]|nr:hypothetical protein DL96DRAFT_351962 [Flagelloscypha sp. PMI_526]
MRRAAKERRDGKPVVPRLNGRGVSFKTEDDEDGTPSPLRSARASAHNSPRPEGPLRECRACKRIVVPTYSSFRACESCRHEETAMRHAKMSQRGTPIRRRGRPRKRRRLGWGSDDEDDDDDMLDDEGEDGSEGEIEEVENLASPSTPYKSPPKRSMVIGGFTIGSVDLETMVAGIVDHEFEPMVREKPPPLLSPNREKKIKELDAQDQADIKRPLPQLFLPATVPPPPPKPVLGGAPFLKVLTPPPPESVEREQLLSPSGSPQQKKQAATDADPNFILQLVPPEAMVGLGLSNNKKSPTTTSAPMVFGRGGSVGDTGVLQLAPMTGLTPPLLSPPPPTITSTAAPVEGPQLQLQPTTSQPTLFRPPSENAVLEDETGLETEPSEPVTLCVSCRRPHYQTASTLKPEMCGICLERHEARKMYETRKISVAKRTPIPEPPSSLFAPPPRLEVAHMDVDEHGQGQGQMLGFEMGQEKPKMEEMRRLMSIVAEKGPQPLPETLEDMVFHANISPSVFLPADAMRVDSAPPPPLSESVPSTRPSSSSTPAAPDESEDERLLIGEFKVCRWCGKSHRRRSDTCTSCRHLGRR